jgi:hypothetical protein
MSGITTTVGSLPQYIATATVPALTTIFTPPASFSCKNRYVAADAAGIAWSTYSRDGYSPPVDPIYYSCLPERLRGPHYSPGVCTEGQTIASMTKFEAGSRTMWQAQCCKRYDTQTVTPRDSTNKETSGLTLALRTIQSSPVPMCVSVISTPLPVRALYTTTYTNGKASSFYEQVINDKSTVSNITTMAKGTAVADPLYVAWEASDLSLFPVAYATSLAQKIGVKFTPTATPASGASRSGASSTGTPLGTGTPPNSNADSQGLSSGAKIGIGVGAGIGAALLAALLAVLFLMRRSRKRNRASTAYPNESTPAMEGHHGGLTKNKWFHRSQPAEEEIELTRGGPNELDSFPVQYQSSQPVELEGSQMPRRGY